MSSTKPSSTSESDYSAHNRQHSGSGIQAVIEEVKSSENAETESKWQAEGINTSVEEQHRSATIAEKSLDNGDTSDSSKGESQTRSVPESVLAKYGGSAGGDASGSWGLGPSARHASGVVESESSEPLRSPSSPPPPAKNEKPLRHPPDTQAVTTYPEKPEAKPESSSPDRKVSDNLNEKGDFGTLSREIIDRTRSPREETYFSEKASRSGEPVGGEVALEDDLDARSEIQSIMEQFEEGKDAPGVVEIMSPRLEFASQMYGASMPRPPRTSSLEPVAPLVPTRSHQSVSSGQSLDAGQTASSNAQVSSPSPPAHGPSSIFKPRPPEPDPEPDLPFDFHRFLEQLRHRSADPVAKFLRSFLVEFGKRQWLVHEQVKLISDFLRFIASRMAQCEVWQAVSDAEFDNAREGMEKLVMNRLYNRTFSPAIPAPEPTTPSKGRRRAVQTLAGPGRRGQHQEDVERDQVLAQKVRIYGWVSEEHLEIRPVGDKGKKFLGLAQQELLKINSYRAPRDKVICVLNCCKVLFGMLRNAQSDQSADAFVPLLIYTVLQANPNYLVSNVQYITRFRNQDKLSGEAGYYISSLMGVVQFIENLDRTNLTVSDDEFEQNVEAAVSAIAERPQEKQKAATSQTGLIPEKSSLSGAEITPRNSLEAERFPRTSTSLRATNAIAGSEDSEENAAIAGLLRSIQKPLSSIGRIFSDEPTVQSQRKAPTHQPALTPQPGATPRSSPSSTPQLQRRASEDGRGPRDAQRRGLNEQRERLRAEDAAALQASAETAEAHRIQRAEHQTVVETLAGMFPALDKDVIDDVVRMKEGRVGLAVDACLALTNP